MLERAFDVNMTVSLATRHADFVWAQVFQKLRDLEPVLRMAVPIVQAFT
jgi:hypothetical protein